MKKKYNYGYKRFQNRFKTAGKVMGTIGTGINVATKAYQIATKLAAIINSEKKYYDVSSNNSPRSGVPIVTHLTGITQGDTDQERHGDSIGLKTLQFNGLLTWDADSSPGDRCRIVLIMDKENEAGTPPTSGLVYDQTDDVYGLRNMLYPKRFRVLMDKVYTLDVSRKTIPIEYYKKFKMQKDFQGNPTQMKHITWQSGDTEARNHIYVLMFCNNASYGPTVYYKSRVRFYDN